VITAIAQRLVLRMKDASVARGVRGDHRPDVHQPRGHTEFGSRRERVEASRAGVNETRCQMWNELLGKAGRAAVKIGFVAAPGAARSAVIHVAARANDFCGVSDFFLDMRGQARQNTFSGFDVANELEWRGALRRSHFRMKTRVDVEPGAILKENSTRARGVFQVYETAARRLHEPPSEFFLIHRVAAAARNGVFAFHAEQGRSHGSLPAILPVGFQKRLAISVDQSAVDSLVTRRQKAVGLLANFAQIAD